MDAAFRHYLRSEVHKRQKERLATELRVVRGMRFATGKTFATEVEYRFSELTSRINHNSPKVTEDQYAKGREARRKKREREHLS